MFGFSIWFAVPVAVFVLGVAAGLEVMSCRMLLIMSVISFGVLVASYGEINISWIGVVYQMGGVVGEALRLIFMEIFVKRKGLKLNPISVMYYVSPCRHVLYSSLNHKAFVFMEDFLLVPYTGKLCLFEHDLCFSMQCCLPVYSMDLLGETKDGSTWDMEPPTSCANTQFTLYFFPQSVSFPCYLTYKCPDNSCGWSCQGLGGCLAVCPSIC